MKLGEVARLAGGVLERGSPELEITGVGGLRDARRTEVSFIAARRHLKALGHSKACCFIAPDDPAFAQELFPSGAAIVRSSDPAAAFERLAASFARPAPDYVPGIHPCAVVSPTAAVDPAASVGPLCVVCDNARIGKGAVLIGMVFVGAGATVGDDSLVYPNVTVREHVEIGKRVIIHSGSVLGSDGFGFETLKDGTHAKIPHRGVVVVGDDVEIGACVTIDRARFARTTIGSGTKIDNLVHVAHNVSIGRNCLIVAQVGIAGSAHVGDSVILAGQAGVDGHLCVGDGARVAGQAGVTSDVEPGDTVAGYPAWHHMKEKRVRAASRKLPELLKEVEALRKRMERVERPHADRESGTQR